jgi:tetratricopeptide (TPR) repeat protein
LRSPHIRKFVHVFSTLAWLAGLILLGGAMTAKAQSKQGALLNYTGISVEPSPQLFATLCALDAAGFGADESTLAEMPSRLALREDLLKMKGPATDALRQFYGEHVLGDPGETLSQYITFALVVGPPPDFRYLVNHELLPPDVLAIEDFQEILANFYREAHLGARWAKIEPEYARAVARYEPPVRKIVAGTDAYLREVLKPRAGHTFTVFVEPLVGNRTNFRNYSDRYAIVLGTSSQIPVDEIQHAYLHFMLDALPLRYRDEIMTRKELLDIAARAPRLPVEYQTDFLALTDECFIKAVELRLRHLSPAKLDASLKDADQAGFILVPPFVAGLQKFEKAEPAMSYYFPDLLAGIDVQVEQERLENIHFAPVPPAAESAQPKTASTQPSELVDWLAQGNREIAEKDAAAATRTFEKILEKYPAEPRATYGLAIASVLGGHAARAKDLFLTLVSAPASRAPDAQKPGEPADPTILAWSHVYLGRIYDLEGDRDAGLAEYRAAIAIEGAPEAARVAAEHGVEEAYSPHARETQGNGNSNTKEPQNP